MGVQQGWGWSLGIPVYTGPRRKRRGGAVPGPGHPKEAHEDLDFQAQIHLSRCMLLQNSRPLISGVASAASMVLGPCFQAGVM